MLFVRYRRAFEHLRFVLKPAIAFEFWSTLIFMVSFAPATGWLLNRLVAASGQFAVSDNDLFAFFLSSQGILFYVKAPGSALIWSRFWVTISALPNGDLKRRPICSSGRFRPTLSNACERCWQRSILIGPERMGQSGDRPALANFKTN